MPRNGHRFALALAAFVVAAWATAMGAAIATAAPPQGRTLALFPFGTLPDRAFAAIARSGARPIGRHWLVWAVETDAGGARRLKAEGALVVLPDLAFVPPLGCAGQVPKVDPVRRSSAASPLADGERKG